MKLHAFKKDPFDGCYTASTFNDKWTFIIEVGEDNTCAVWLHDEVHMMTCRVCGAENVKEAQRLARREATTL